MTSANAAIRLIAHYAENARQLPWRERGRVPDPYRVWLSEVMLQQTTVAAVASRFERFIARWPSLEALAAAADGDILSEWAGLGYYARARNLIACARAVAAMGGFPTSEAGLRSLPGVGEYTAAAVAAIAFGQRSAVVDTNVRRVIARMHGLAAPLASEVRAHVLALTPADAPGDFAQAMMDLGATICRPKAPRCNECPLLPDCAAGRSGHPQAFPTAKAKARKPHRFGTVRWIQRGDRIWLIRRPPSGLLGGMAALPGSDWTDGALSSEPALAVVRHVFTHFTLDLAVLAAGESEGEGWWQPIATLGDAGLPTLYRKAVDLTLRNMDRRAAA